VKFKTLHAIAKELDNSIDDYIINEKIGFLSFSDLEKTVMNVLPNAVMVDFGLHKLVFSLRHKTHILALKVGRAQAIELDHKVYKQMPKDGRDVYFARIFWHTKYSLLQEWGIEVEVSPQQLLQLRGIAEKYGLLDVTCDNIRSFNGNLKIIDAVLAPKGMFKLWKTYDFINQNLPTPVRKAIRKSRKLFAFKT
jgi:hypothetical protein